MREGRRRVLAVPGLQGPSWEELCWLEEHALGKPGAHRCHSPLPSCPRSTVVHRAHTAERVVLYTYFRLAATE